MAYGYVHLPEEFTSLLQMNMQTSGEGYAHLKRNCWPAPQFQSVACRASKDLGHNMSFEQTINTLGWLGLRDRMAAYYLNHQFHGHYPETTTLELLEDILEFEEAVKNISLNGYSRAFLFGFYLKMGYFEEQNMSGKTPNKQMKLISDDIIEVLNLVEKRIIPLDWLCLSLHYLLKFRGKEKVLKLLRAGGGFESLKSEISPQEEFLMTKAFLAYGASIYQQEAFYNPTV